MWSAAEKIAARISATRTPRLRQNFAGPLASRFAGAVA
jgi:hypothetical protein